MNFFETMNSRLNLDSFFPSMTTKIVAISISGLFFVKHSDSDASCAQAVTVLY